MLCKNVIILMLLAASSSVTTNSLTVTESAVSTQTILRESTHALQLWHISLIAFSLLLVISMVFVMAVLIGRRIIREKVEGKRRTYSTRSRQGLHYFNK